MRITLTGIVDFINVVQEIKQCHHSRPRPNYFVLWFSGRSRGNSVYWI